MEHEKWRLDYTYEGACSSARGCEMLFPPKTDEKVIRERMERFLRQMYPKQDNETLTLRRIQENPNVDEQNERESLRSSRKTCKGSCPRA